jgi:hypothetical protein
MKINYPFPLSDLKIILKRDECYGSCPVYKVEIRGTGEVVYHGVEFVKIKGEQRSTISKKDILELFKYAQEIGFFELKSSYVNQVEYELDKNELINRREGFVTCQPGCTVEIHIGEKKKEVYDYFGAPKRLRRFEKMIDRVCQIEKWIGTESESINNY